MSKPTAPGYCDECWNSHLLEWSRDTLGEEENMEENMEEKDTEEKAEKDTQDTQTM